MINRRLLAAMLGLAFATFACAQEIERPPDASEPAPAVNLTKADATDEGVEPIRCGNVAPDIVAAQPTPAVDIRCRRADVIMTHTIVAGR